MRRLTRALLAGGAAVALCVGLAAPAGAESTDQDHHRAWFFPCGWRHQQPATYDHVVWIVFENTSYHDIVGNPNAPAFNYLSRSCGTETAYYGLTHPSFRNYIAATTGVDWHGGPQSCDPLDPFCGGLPFPSVFGQVAAAGRQWRSYVESMPSNCALSDAPPLYEVHHNPAPYYLDAADRCGQWNIPLGTVTGGALSDDLRHDTLPAFSFVLPDTTHFMTGSTLAASDQWLGRWMARILTSPAYLSGHTAVFVTFDEGNGGINIDEDCAVTLSEGCHVATLAIAPGIRPGTVDSTVTNHYALLRTTEELLGFTDFLGLAATAPSMRAAFGM